MSDLDSILSGQEELEAEQQQTLINLSRSNRKLWRQNSKTLIRSKLNSLETNLKNRKRAKKRVSRRHPIKWNRQYHSLHFWRNAISTARSFIN